jgi:diguanylate cyclase (GGDEF)-like protein
MSRMNFKLSFIIIYILVYYVVIWVSNEAAEDLNLHFQLIASMIAAIWVYRTTQLKSGKERYFWLFLFLGCLSYSVAQALWNVETILLNEQGVFISPEIFWTLQYIFFLTALLFGMYLYKKALGTFRVLCDVLIFTAVSVTLIWDILIETLLDNNKHWVLFTLPLYSISNLVLFLGFLSLYAVSQNNYLLRSVLPFISLGFFVKFTANLFGFYLASSLSLTGYFGSFMDPLWSLGLLLLGYAGTYHPNKDVDQEILKKIQYSYPFIPYVSACILFFFMFSDFQTWDGLVVGSIVTFVFLVVRQYITSHENRSLLRNYEELNQNLENKIIERTKLIHEKSGQLERVLNHAQEIAYYDSLTKLPNRNKLIMDLDQMLISKDTVTPLSVLYIDLDKFRMINDTVGHKQGDVILKIAADQFIQCIEGKQAAAYHIDGDEFILLIQDEDKDEIIKLSDCILNEFAKPLTVNGIESFISVSTGISMYPMDGTHSETLIKNADMAMALAKDRGRNNFQFYNSSLHDLKMRRLKIELGLRHAIANNELALNYQPQINLATGKIEGFEALLRWEHPELGKVSPLEFIPIAEETGQIVSIGEWALNEACAANKRWQETNPPVRFAVNVSVRQLNAQLSKSLITILEASTLEPQYIDLEITESIMQNIEESMDILGQIKRLGVKISIDDFGTGYSSLNMLQHLPIDYVKIDRSFIHDLIANTKTAAIVKTIINMSHDLGFKVIAEGIENEQQLNILKKLHCDIGQGYYFSRPLVEKQIIEHRTN